MPTCFGKLICAHKPEGDGKHVVPTCLRKPICAHKPEGWGANLLWPLHIRTVKQDGLLLSWESVRIWKSRDTLAPQSSKGRAYMQSLEAFGTPALPIACVYATAKQEWNPTLKTSVRICHRQPRMAPQSPNQRAYIHSPSHFIPPFHYKNNLLWNIAT